MPKRMALHIGAYAACIMMSPWPLGAAHANFHGFRTCCAGPAQPRMGQEGKYQGQVLVLKGLSYLIPKCWVHHSPLAGGYMQHLTL